MNEGEILFWLVELAAGIYMIGIGFKFIPDPGKKDSAKNEEHLNKFRSIFKIGGILIVAHVLLSVVGSTL